MTQFFTVDVEEYFQVAALEPYLPRSQWASQESRVERSVNLLLELLAQRHASGTFFVLGTVAQSHPHLVRTIAAAGHEIASHGWSHRSVTALSRAQFRDELVRSRDLLRDLTGRPVIGYRAPNFSVRKSCSWVFDELIAAEYLYDASIFPGRGSGRDFPVRGPVRIRRPSGLLWEVPMVFASFGGLQIPAAGGAWFRLLPYGLTTRALRQCAARAQPGVFYIHPWELDPGQPHVHTNFRTHVRHYGGLHRVADRLRRLLREFDFVSIERWLTQQDAPSPRHFAIAGSEEIELTA